MTDLVLEPGKAKLPLWRALAENAPRVALSQNAWPVIARSREIIEDALASGRAVYGVNTGFGLLARTRIDDARLAELQRALVLSHSAGTGPLIDDAYHSDLGQYRQTMGRLRELPVKIVHAGHDPSFCGSKLKELAQAYLHRRDVNRLQGQDEAD